jgi:bis(5'-nucleosyl)-tetraphosphatase (symmetrical)
MSVWAVGDIQGCYRAFSALMEKIAFDPTCDRLWAVGDLVNRGENNLSVLRWFYEHREAVAVVLGNHDLHLLAAARGHKRLGKSDNLHDVLEATDGADLIDWLRHRPLLHREGRWVMTHAGIPSIWSIEQAADYAAEVEATLRSPDIDLFFQHMYGNEPCRWSPLLRGKARLRTITNYLTRMRYCTISGSLDFRNKGPVTEQAGMLCGETLRPWFMHRGPSDIKLLFGHWAALNGATQREDIVGLDTGCVWGGVMTALNLDTGERVQQPND